MKKRVICFLFAILFITVPVFGAAAMPDQSAMKYNVYDELGVLSAEDIAYFNKTNLDLKDKTGGEIAVAVVSDLRGMTPDEYATAFFDKIKIGDKNKDNGTLLLMAIYQQDGKQQRKVVIRTGRGTEGFIPDVIAARIFRNMATLVHEKEKQGDTNPYGAALQEGYNSIITCYEREYQVNIEAKEPYYSLDTTTESRGLSFREIVIIVFFLLFITSMFGGGRGRRRRGGGFFFGPPFGGGFGGGFGGFGGGFGGGGGFSGGSGGGFGGFGGGGSTGGGGSGGSF